MCYVLRLTGERYRHNTPCWCEMERPKAATVIITQGQSARNGIGVRGCTPDWGRFTGIAGVSPAACAVGQRHGCIDNRRRLCNNQIKTTGN